MAVDLRQVDAAATREESGTAIGQGDSTMHAHPSLPVLKSLLEQRLQALLREVSDRNDAAAQALQDRTDDAQPTAAQR